MKDVDEEANLILCSHDHRDHGAVEVVNLVNPEAECPWRIAEIASFHDDVHGEARGNNTIRILDNGNRIIHYGDIGMDIDELLTEENLELLKGADVALVPIGGFYTIDAGQALDLIGRTQPKLVIPMHYRSADPVFGYDVISDISEFIPMAEAAGYTVKTWGSEYDTAEGGSDASILVMRPAAL